MSLSTPEAAHHVTMITADVRENVRFYADFLGLRLVKKTVNFDEPSAYHLYFGDETGSPGSILTWFGFPDAARGRPGAGMIHRIELGVPSETSLDFWEHRMHDAARPAKRTEATLEFADYEGLGLALVLSEQDERPLIARDPEIPPEHAITGIRGARAYAAGDTGSAEHEALLSETLGFDSLGEEYLLDGTRRGFRWAYDPPPDASGDPGCRDRPPHRVGLRRRRSARVAGAGPSGGAPGDPRARPRILHLDLLP